MSFSNSACDSTALNCGNSCFTFSGAWNQKAGVRLDQHGGVVVGIAGGDDVVIHPFEGGDGLALLFPDAQLVIHDAVVFHDEPVAQQRRANSSWRSSGAANCSNVSEKNDDLHQRAEFIQKFLRAGQRTQRADDVSECRTV